MTILKLIQEKKILPITTILAQNKLLVAVKNQIAKKGIVNAF